MRVLCDLDTWYTNSTLDAKYKWALTMINGNAGVA